MAKLATKHENQQVEFLGDFSGGLNTSTSEEFIENNQLANVVNMEIDSISKKLYTVFGTEDVIELKGNGRIIHSIWDSINSQMVVITDKSKIIGIRYTSDSVTYRIVGDLLTNEHHNISSVTWEDGVIIASGRNLQYLVYNENDIYTLKNLDTSPEVCYGVFVRSGRIVVNDGDDNLLYSAVGNEEDWVQDPNDPSTSIFAEIGYKIGGKILCTCHHSTDVLIIKNNGLCFKLENEYPDWKISEVSRELYCKNMSSACSIGNGIAMVLGDGILQNIQTTQEYGDMKPSQMGQQVNRQICSLPQYTKLKYIASMNQVWFITETSYVLVYDCGTQSFYQRLFNAPVNDVLSVGQLTFLMRDDRISVISYNGEECKDFGEPLVYEAIFKTDISNHYYLIKNESISVTPIIRFYDKADINFQIGKLTIPFPKKEKGTKLVQTIGETQRAKELEEIDENLAQKSVLLRLRKMFRTDRVRLSLSGKGFPFYLNFITYDKVEV